MGKVKVKILGLSLAHRKGRNTAWMVEYALKAAEKFGRRVGDVAEVKTEFMDLANKKIEMCWECPDYPCRPNNGADWKKGSGSDDFGCPIKDDYLAKKVMPKVAEADAFVLGCPVYTGTCTSLFITVMERFKAGIWKGYFSNKPVGSITVGTMPIGGHESTLQQMNNVTRYLEMIPVQVGLGACGISGPPYGPLAADDDGKLIGIKNDKYSQWQCVCVGRRVAEVAVMFAISKKQLGKLYNDEFALYYTPPHGDIPRDWFSLDATEYEYMMNLTPSTFRG
jgi:multimeric flavodoxin WrbA